MATTYLISEFRETNSLATAIHALRAVGVTDQDMDIFSEEPVEFHKGVLDRPSKMSLVSVAGAVIFGGGCTLLMGLAQYNYPVPTGGMPLFSMWGTGVITYETTMMGAVFATFGYFLWESGLIRKRDKTAPVPKVPPEMICLRVRCAGDTAKATSVLMEMGAPPTEQKVTA
ncbi:MAG TPA: quinol:electron acceptor oxidoreductase subunit ActD [Bryobacteraceae bacterium]|nr:quinol:electron acceptor oxidoreductase subunit ActD [Bryobacteraceae bacterium]